MLPLHQFLIVTALLLDPLAGHGICAAAPVEGKKAEAEMEFVRVAANRWTFEQVPSSRRFVPFGCNLVFNYPNGDGLDQGLFILAQPKWDPQTLHKAFAAARSLNMNVMKVFLPSHLVLPDPQAGGKVVLGKMEPPLLDRLDEMFQIARKNKIYIVLTFSEWGGGGLRWWQDGGTFIGHPGVPLDSFAVLAGFWKQIAGRYKNEPALFSYNLAVEFIMPQGNWSAGKGGEPKNASVLNERWGLPAWQAWLKESYGTVAAINKAWGTQHADFCEIPQPDYIFDGRTYSVPQAMLADYNSFREYVSYAFFKNQVDAIRAEDTRHMISCGMHPAQTLGGWQGSAWFHNGLNFAEMDLFDYTTTHLYTNASDNKPGVSPKGIHGSIVGARMAYAGRPVIIEEMGHIVKDRAETTRETIRQLESLIPHASGFMLWFLSDIKDAPYGPLNPDLTINEFGLQWRKLVENGGALANSPVLRAPAATVISVSRLEGMAPVAPTACSKLMDGWDKVAQPVDFKMPPNLTLERLRCKQ